MIFRKSLIATLFTVFVFFGCSEYHKLLNSDNTAEKHKQAEMYYNNGEYRKASRLFEQIIPKYRGKPQAERFIFFLANCHFNTGDYHLSVYRYENFVKSYPKSQKVQEANFKSAKSYYYLSPRYSLDQKDTHTAIEKLQFFIRDYPNSEYFDEAIQLIAELQTKLERKEFEIAKQYYTIKDYPSAIKALDNFTGTFPGTKFREEALYVKFLSAFEIAINSRIAKKLQRLNELKQQYALILNYYPETVFQEELSKKMKTVEREIDRT